MTPSESATFELEKLLCAYEVMHPFERPACYFLFWWSKERQRLVWDAPRQGYRVYISVREEPERGEAVAVLESPKRGWRREVGARVVSLFICDTNYEEMAWEDFCGRLEETERCEGQGRRAC